MNAVKIAGPLAAGIASVGSSSVAGDLIGSLVGWVFLKSAPNSMKAASNQAALF